jgi:diguanylate cyclase (GGDEF)-like protein
MNTYIKPKYQQRASKQLYQDLASRSFLGVIFYVTAWAALILPQYSYFFSSPRIHTTLVLSTIIASAALIRLLAIFIYRAHCSKNNNNEGKLLLIGATISSSAWGFSSAYLVLSPAFQDIITQLMLCTTGICAGGLASLAPSKRFLAFFLAPMLVPPTIALVLLDHPFSNSQAALSALLFFAMFGISNIQRKEYFNALNSQYQLEEKSALLAELSTLDPLTGLKNKRYFEEKLNDEFHRAIRDSKPISLILIDLDHFKQVNDIYGHLIGDECLKEMSRTLTTKFNRSMDTLARVGGEEFAVLLPTLPHDKAMLLADKLRRQIENISIRYADETISITASLGVATLYPTEENNAHELFHRADVALYEAKRQGRNRVACAPVFDLAVKRAEKKRA